MVQRLGAAAQSALPTPVKPPCPYPGMVPFKEGDSALFFGRETEVQEMIQRLRVHPFLTVIGPSGSGKSSVVSAGLVPALRKSGLVGKGPWLFRTLRPDTSPLESLRAVFNDDLSNPTRVWPRHFCSRIQTQGSCY